MSPSSDEAPRVDDVESRLADATAELIFLRANEKRLLEENTHLKARCERLSVELLEGRTYAVRCEEPTRGLTRDLARHIATCGRSRSTPPRHV